MAAPVLATETLAAIDAALAADGGNAYRRHLAKTIAEAHDAYAVIEPGRPERSHLGASTAGIDCGRRAWLSWRWAAQSQPEPRMIRLFNRGHLEEARFIALLQSAGFEVWQHDENDRQFKFSDFDGHYGGAVDAVVLGLPEDPETPHLGEFKTHATSSFKKLVKTGVMSAKFEHFVQMQEYMGYLDLPKALYLAVNKDNDDLYGEIVTFDRPAFDAYRNRAHTMLRTTTVPRKIGRDASYFVCRMCTFVDVCHNSQPMVKSCRSCINSAPAEKGSWVCKLTGLIMSKRAQIEGCSDYQTIELGD